MTLQDAEILALQILKQVMEEKINATNVEIAVVPTATRQFKVYSSDYLEISLSQNSRNRKGKEMIILALF